MRYGDRMMMLHGVQAAGTASFTKEAQYARHHVHIDAAMKQWCVHNDLY
jgi:hypothetical protein